jgi:LAO/AO transport system kinase
MAKAGVLEIADVLVVNKADRENADRTVAELQMMVGMGGSSGGWTTPVLKTMALRGEGITELAEALREHHRHLDTNGLLAARRLADARRRILSAGQELAWQTTLRQAGNALLDSLSLRVANSQIDPYTAADELLAATGTVKK